MILDIQKRRSQIIKRICHIPKDKLNELDIFISKLEQDMEVKDKTLSFAGMWKDLDNSVFEDLTEKLISNRQKNRRRIDE